jgi:hypothetical protein
VEAELDFLRSRRLPAAPPADRPRSGTAQASAAINTIATGASLRDGPVAEHGGRPAELLADGALVELADSHTLMRPDRPGRLAAAVREFTRASATKGAG